LRRQSCSWDRAADPGYNYRDNFNHATFIGAEPEIKSRGNTKSRSRGSYARAKVVRECLTVLLNGKKIMIWLEMAVGQNCCLP